jgi:hypothetical protein
MNIKMKTLTVLLVALLAGGALMMVQAQTDANVPSTVPPAARPLYKQVEAGRWRLVGLLIRNGEPTTLSGKVVTYNKGLLVLDSGTTVVVPDQWIQRGSVISREDLLKNLVGTSVTINTLKLEYTNKYTATVYFAYGIDDASALLPWNITPLTTS